jgi:hypothetical protein
MPNPKSQYSLVEHIARSLSPVSWKRINLAMFIAYFDGSGTASSQPVVTVAGFLSSAEKWVDFEVNWISRLKDDGLPYFRTTEFNASRGPFKVGWKDNKIRRDKLIRDLVEIIGSYANRKFGAGITVRNLKAFSPSERKRWHISAYSLAGRSCAGKVRQWAKSWSGPMPEIVFEEGDEGESDLRKTLLEDEDFKNVQFRPKKDGINKSGIPVKGVIPLQAADLMAYEMFDPYRKIHNDGYIRRIKTTYEKLERIPGEVDYMPIESMELLSKVMRAKKWEIVEPPKGYIQR